MNMCIRSSEIQLSLNVINGSENPNNNDHQLFPPSSCWLASNYASRIYQPAVSKAFQLLRDVTLPDSSSSSSSRMEGVNYPHLDSLIRSRAGILGEKTRESRLLFNRNVLRIYDRNRLRSINLGPACRSPGVKISLCSR